MSAPSTAPGHRLEEMRRLKSRRRRQAAQVPRRWTVAVSAQGSGMPGELVLQERPGGGFQVVERRTPDRCRECWSRKELARHQEESLGQARLALEFERLGRRAHALGFHIEAVARHLHPWWQRPDPRLQPLLRRVQRLQRDCGMHDDESTLADVRKADASLATIESELRAITADRAQRAKGCFLERMRALLRDRAGASHA